MIESELLLDAYCDGIFPMAIGRRGDIGWFSPDPRAIIPINNRFHIPHGLRRVLKQKKFDITFDTDFKAVIRACAKRKEGTWISKKIIESYCNLYRLGYAHSVEVWQVDQPKPKTEMLRQAQHDKKREATASSLHAPRSTSLVGGLYGVHIGGAFFGESMFHRATDASKVALVALVGRLRACGFTLLDTQWLTPHLAQFGTYEIPRAEYLRRLRRAVAMDCQF